MTIRRKITVLLGLLALVMLFQSIDRVVYLERSAESFQRLSVRVEQRLANLQILSQATHRLDALPRGLTQTDDFEVLKQNSDEISAILFETRRAVTSLARNESEWQNLEAQLDAVGQAVDTLANSRTSTISINLQRRDLRRELEDRAQALQSHILPLKVDILSEARFRLDRSMAEESLRLLITLTALFDRIDDLLATPLDALAPGIESDIARLTSSSLVIVSLSGQFDDGALGLLLAQIFQIISGDDGFGSSDQALRNAKANEAEAFARLDAATSRMSVALSRIVSASESEIAEVYRAAALSAERKRVSEIIVNAGFGLGIVIAVWLVFARQISLRLERLNRNVLRLAAGDLAPVEKDVGGDELSRMARALEVFRNNAKELRRSNEELANFAYVASHDLRTPLRAIRDLVDWTLEDQDELLDDVTRSNLSQIRSRADRLSNLLKDLLDYARAGQGASKATQIDLEGMVGEIGDLIGQPQALRLTFRGVRHIQGDAIPVRTILLNLVTNSVKHRDRAIVHVDVTVRGISGGWELKINDNGPGIPLRYQRKVFELFKTLKSRDDVEGSGLGLAMVDKLVTHLEGSISIVSDPDRKRGTTFILRIPAPDKRLPTQYTSERSAA